MTISYGGFEYYQLQVTVPEDRCSLVVKKLATFARPITKIHASLSFLLFARVHASKLLDALGELDLNGVGTAFGVVEVIPLALTMPLFSVEETRKEKLREAERKTKEQNDLRPNLESIFSLPNEKDLNTINTDIYKEPEKKEITTLVKAWDMIGARQNENLKMNRATSPRRKKTKLKSPRKRSNTKESSEHTKKVKSPRKKTKANAVEEKKHSHHHHHHHHHHHSQKRNNTVDVPKTKPSVNLWDSLDGEEISSSQERLLWGPKLQSKKKHTKARSVDYKSTDDFSVTTQAAASVQRTKTVPGNKEIAEVINISAEFDKSDDNSGNEKFDFSFEGNDNDNDNDTIEFSMNVDDDDDDDANDPILIDEKPGDVVFSIDTDDEGDENVFLNEGSTYEQDTIEFSMQTDDVNEVSFSVQTGDDDNDILPVPLDVETNDINFTIETNDSDNDNDSEINFTIESSDESEETDKFISFTLDAESKMRAKQFRKSTPNLFMPKIDTQKQRISASDHDKKPQLDSVATVQQLFQIPEIEKDKSSPPKPIEETNLPNKTKSKRRPHGKIIAEQFIVHDSSGNERACFGMDSDDSVSIKISDSSSSRVIKIEISGTSETEMGMHFTVDGNSRLSHHINSANEIETALYGSDFESHSKMRVHSTNSPELTLGIKDQTLINLRGTQDIAELNPTNALVSLRSDPGFSGLSICDTDGGTRATLGWYDLKKLLRLEKQTDIVMIQMSGREASQDLDNFPEATISVIDNVAKVYATDKNKKIKEFPTRQVDDEVSVLVNIEKGGAQLGLVHDEKLRTLGPSKTQQLLNAYGFNL